MIQITRNLARKLRSVLRRALNVTSHGLQPAVVFESGPDGFRIRCHSDETAVEYYQPGKLAPEQIAAPFELLADCEGRKEEPLTLEVEGTGVLASWRDGSIPQIARYETPRGKQGPFPEMPGNLVSNEPRLWQALQDAMSTTNPDSLRYALGCLQLRPTGQIVATDGRQVLVQSGFAFPWESDLLVPVNKLFGCRDVPQDASLLVGGGPHRVTLQTEPWTIHLSVLKEGRFPQVDELLRRPEDALTRWQISDSDAEFLSQGLSRLRTAEDEFQAVTIDLHKGAVIRAGGAKESPPTELVLSSSPPSGQPLRMATDRRYLARALRLGFRELLFYGEEVAVTASDGQRQYLWAPLEQEAVVAPSPNAIRVESSGEPTTVNSLPSQPKRNRTMPRAKTKTEDNGSEPVQSNGLDSNGHASQQEPDAIPASDTLVAEALALKQSLQDALAKTNGLIAALKRQGRQSRLIESTLRSLRQFQTVTG